MSDELLPYYNRELSFIRGLGAEFAEKSSEDRRPAAARAEGSRRPARRAADRGVRLSELRASGTSSTTISRRSPTRCWGCSTRIISAPIPSMSVVQFDLDRGQDELTAATRFRAARRSRPSRSRASRAGSDLLRRHALAHRAANRRRSHGPALCRPGDSPVAAEARPRAAHWRWPPSRPRSTSTTLQPRVAAVLPQAARPSTSTACTSCSSTTRSRLPWQLAPGRPAGRAGPECLRPVGFEPATGAAAVLGADVCRLPAARGVFRVPGEVPVLRPGRPGTRAAGALGQPAGNLLLSQPDGGGLEQNVTADTFRWAARRS